VSHLDVDPLDFAKSDTAYSSAASYREVSGIRLMDNRIDNVPCASLSNGSDMRRKVDNERRRNMKI